jgi:acyl-CoA thioester hydrolase
MTLQAATPKASLLAASGFTWGPCSVYPADTDCYNVVWHGTYARWLEAARVDFCYAIGVRLTAVDTAQSNDEGDALLYPVIEQHVRFKAPLRLGDTFTLHTMLRIEQMRLCFTQSIIRCGDKATLLTSETTCLVMNQQWRLQRRLPTALLPFRQKEATSAV